MVSVDLYGYTREVVSPGVESFTDGEELLFTSRVVDLSGDHFPGVEGDGTLNSVDCLQEGSPDGELAGISDQHSISIQVIEQENGG